jgi:hypothetical protein
MDKNTNVLFKNYSFSLELASSIMIPDSIWNKDDDIQY